MLRFIFVFLFSVVTLTLAAKSPAAAQQRLIEYQVLYSKFSPKDVPIKDAHKGRLAGKMQEITLEGLRLWVAKPRKGQPSVLFLHGSTGGLAKRGWKYLWLIKEGFGVVAMSYPGSSGSTGRASTKSILRAAHNTFRAMPKLVGNSPVIVMGESFGTGVAVRLASELAREGRAPAGVALQAPYSSIQDLVRHQAPLAAGYFKGNRDPWPSQRLIKSLDIPLYIMHGGRDKRVPVAQGKRLFDLSPATNKHLSYRADAKHGNIWTAKGVRTELLKWMRNLN